MGTAGDDTLEGGAGADTFVFDPEDGSGNDTITDFTQGEDLIDLSAFSTISGFSDLTFTSDDEGVTLDLTALGGGNELLIGAAGDDSIAGGGGSDTLLGRAGDDTLDGGSGGDSYWGGEGADTFVVGPDNSENILWDFRDGEDVIDLTAFTGISGCSFPITVAASSGSRRSRAPTSIPNRRRVRHRGGRSPPPSCPAQHGRASRGVEARIRRFPCARVQHLIAGRPRGELDGAASMVCGAGYGALPHARHDLPCTRDLGESPDARAAAARAGGVRRLGAGPGPAAVEGLSGRRVRRRSAWWRA